MTDAVRITTIRGAHVVWLRGDIDLANIKDIALRIAESLSDARVAIVDLSEVTYLDSSGVQLLFQLSRSLDSQRVPMRIALPLDSHLRRLMQIIDLGATVPIAEDVTRALAAYENPDLQRRHPGGCDSAEDGHNGT